MYSKPANSDNVYSLYSSEEEIVHYLQLLYSTTVICMLRAEGISFFDNLSLPYFIDVTIVCSARSIHLRPFSVKPFDVHHSATRNMLRITTPVCEHTEHTQNIPTSDIFYTTSPCTSCWTFPPSMIRIFFKKYMLRKIYSCSQ